MTASHEQSAPALLDRLAELEGDALKHAKTIASSWRDLTGGCKTLVAVSGGADSLALLLSLRRVSEDLVCAYIRHDQRPERDTQAELDGVQRIACSLRVPFAQGHAHATDGNIEASLREDRYNELVRIAREHDCPFVTTGHHADDQLETMLLAIVRGAGPAGIGGMGAARSLDEDILLARPMLGVTHEQAIAICQRAGVEWFEDPTNAHLNRSRALLREKVLPSLRTINPACSTNASRGASQLYQSSALLAAMADASLEFEPTWERSHLASMHPYLLATALRRRVLLHTDGLHADRLSASRIEEVVSAIRDDKQHQRTFEMPGGITIEVHAHRVEFIAPSINP